MKVIFIGTPSFAIPTLTSLIESPHIDVVCVVTQPDRPVGRKQIMEETPVKQLAKKHNIPVLQPEKIQDITTAINSQKPDMIVVAAYAQLIPQKILNIPRYGCINVHGSLLPKYRGSSCIQAAIINGDKKSGVTIMKMEAGLDTGPILAQKEIELDKLWTSDDLYVKISELSGEIIEKTILDYASNSIKPTPQDDTKASLVKNLKKNDGQIDLSKTAEEIERFVRAMHSWPGAFIHLTINGESSAVKMIEVDKEILEINTYEPGQLFIHDNKLAIQCRDAAIAIKKIQLPGKKPMTSEQFINGYQKLVSKLI